MKWREDVTEESMPGREDWRDTAQGRGREGQWDREGDVSEDGVMGEGDAIEREIRVIKCPPPKTLYSA